MSTVATVVALVFSGFGFFAPVSQPDGQGGQLVYQWTQEQAKCQRLGSAVVSPGGSSGTWYFCEVKP